MELQLGTPWPLPQVEVKATLAHKFELIGKIVHLSLINHFNGKVL